MNHYEIKEFYSWAKSQDISAVAEAGINADIDALIDSALGNVADVAKEDQAMVAKATFEMLLDDLEGTRAIFGDVA